LVSEACFLAGLIKVSTQLDGAEQEAWKPQAVYHYIQDRYVKPDLIVDISEYMERKMLAIKAYETQFFNPTSKEPMTAISKPEFMDFLYGRAAEFGRTIGTKYGEGFTVERTPGINSFASLL
jgi:LmbE family N-acetylglucosaminyl deacetylase